MPRLTPSSRRSLAAVAALAIALTACGGDDGGDAAADSSVASTAPATTAAAGSTTPTAAAFPVTIEHKYGSTTIDAPPARVVSVGFRDQDFLLALDVVPVGIRDWYGDQPHGVWPWAQPRLGTATPALLDAGEINFEAVAALDPDLIVGITSGMSDTDYAALARIAPTLAQPGEYADFGTPWQETTRIIGRAVGQEAAADEIVAGIDAQYAAARAAHPEFDGATVTVAFVSEGEPGAYNSQQTRSRLLSDLGFVVPAEIDRLAGDEFFFTVSEEQLPVVDTDVIVWITPNAQSADAIVDLALRPQLRAFAEGREVLTTVDLAAAFAFGSPLSIAYVLEQLVPDLAAAVDGDPATAVSQAAILAPA